MEMDTERRGRYRVEFRVIGFLLKHHEKDNTDLFNSLSTNDFLFGEHKRAYDSLRHAIDAGAWLVLNDRSLTPLSGSTYIAFDGNWHYYTDGASEVEDIQYYMRCLKEMNFEDANKIYTNFAPVIGEIKKAGRVTVEGKISVTFDAGVPETFERSPLTNRVSVKTSRTYTEAEWDMVPCSGRAERALLDRMEGVTQDLLDKVKAGAFEFESVQMRAKT